MSDVARLAGVSAKTVSRVYTEPGSVAPDTTSKVMDAARRLHFTPNRLARDLRRGAVSHTVGFVTPEPTNPFYVHVAAGIGQVCAEQGLTMMIASSADAGSETDVIDTLVAQRVRAILLVPSLDDYAHLDQERHLGTAIVAIDRPTPNLLADSVLLDNAQGGRDATRILLEHGHTKIGYVCNPRSVFTQEQRVAAYRQTVREATGGSTTPWERTSDDPHTPLDDLVSSLLDGDDPPTAIIGGNNRATAAIIRQLTRRRLDLAVVGVDDFEFADLFDVSVITHDAEEMGRVAARLAIHRMSEPTGAPEHRLLPLTYIPRGSGERAAPPGAAPGGPPTGTH